MFKEAWHMTEDTLPDEAREWVRTSFSNAIMTVKEVQEKWGLSQSTVSRLYTKHDWPFAFKKGNQILFITEFAVPWFEAYNAQQDVNRSKAKIKEDKPKKPGRPPKVNKEAWRDTHLGDWHIVIGPEYESAQKWFNAISDRMSRELPLNSPERAQWIETREALRAHFGIRAGL